jgi:hypothetical protein
MMASKQHQAAGRALVAKMGKEHMAKIGRRGAAVFYSRYEWRPIYQAQFALVVKATGKVIAFSDGRPVGRRFVEG